MSRKTRRKHRSSRHKRSRRHRRRPRRRHSRKRRTRHKCQHRHRHKKMRGGAVYGTQPYPPAYAKVSYPASPAAPLPLNETILPSVPGGGPYNPSSDTNGLDGGYYYRYNTNVVEPPMNVSASQVIGSGDPEQKGGGCGCCGRCRLKSRRKRRGTRKKRGGRRKRRRRRKTLTGGGLLSPSNSVVEAVPMGTDLRDAYWGTGNSVVNAWNTWNGQPNNISTNPAIQPIGAQGLLGFASQPGMTDLVHDTSMQAAKYV